MFLYQKRLERSELPRLRPITEAGAILQAWRGAIQVDSASLPFLGNVCRTYKEMVHPKRGHLAAQAPPSSVTTMLLWRAAG